MLIEQRREVERKARLTSDLLTTLESGVRYQIYHALAMRAVTAAITCWPTSNLPNIAGWLFVAGTLLFSGSLYLLCFTRKRWLSAVTPFGGLAFMGRKLALIIEDSECDDARLARLITPSEDEASPSLSSPHC